MIETIHRWQQVKCPAEGKAVTFSFNQQFPSDSQIPAHDYEGFIVCYNGKFSAYRNSCPHMGSPLDWLPNQFFSEDGTELVCHTHDARFDPVTGDCLSGPCEHGLEIIPLRNIQSDSIEVPADLTSKVE